MKQLILLLTLVIGLIFTLISLPLAPQVYPTELLSQNGGRIVKEYRLTSLRAIYNDLDSSFKFFPHNKDTRRYNRIALFIASVVVGLIVFSFGYFGFRIMMKSSEV